MGHLFYVVGIFLILALASNFLNFNNYYKIRNWLITFRKITKKDPSKDEFREKKDQEIFATYTSISLFEFFWYLIGITSSSWYIFCTLIVSNFLLNIVTFAVPTGFIGKYIFKFFILIKILMILILILNHFHFHKDLFSLLVQH
jgi:hypothetical protein